MSGPLVESFSVAATLAAQRIVSHIAGTAYSVNYPTSNQELPLGVTIDNVLDTTSSIPVQLNGIAKVLFNDTVTSGALVSSDTSGRGIPFVVADTTTALTLSSAYVGTLIGPKVDVAGTIGKVLINPGLDRE